MILADDYKECQIVNRIQLIFLQEILYVAELSTGSSLIVYMGILLQLTGLFVDINVAELSTG